jgi:FdhD protein
VTLPGTVSVRIDEYENGVFCPREVSVVAEYPFVLKLNGKPLANLACSGTDLEPLAIGHLLAEGLIRSVADVLSVSVDEEHASIDVAMVAGKNPEPHRTTAGGYLSPADSAERSLARLEQRGPVRKPAARIKAETVCDLIEEFLRTSRVYARTGAVHSAALSRLSGERLVFYDEIGRHNAMDKAIGYAAREKLNLAELMILTTGRMPAEILSKIITVGAPILVSKAPPTSLAVQWARRHGVVMIGNVRPAYLRVFSGREWVEA